MYIDSYISSIATPTLLLFLEPWKLKWFEVQTRPYLRNFTLRSFRLFLLTGKKAQRDEDGGRILLGDNTGGGAVMLRLIRFCCVWGGISLPCIYICI